MHLPPGSLDLVPIIPVVAIGVWGTLRVLKGHIGQAIADRIRGSSSVDNDGEVEALRDEVDSLRAQLDEAQDKIEFMDRLLIKRDESSPTPV